MSVKRKAVDSIASDSKRPQSITSFFAPKEGPNPAKASPALSKFKKAEWVKGLTQKQRELLDLEIRTLDDTWLWALKEDIVTPSFLGLKEFLKKEKGPIYPPPEDIYSWSRHCPLNTVKVVILGQDPYHGPNQAMGMSFSVRASTPPPPSLRNMFKALQNDYPSFTPPRNKSGDLRPWADRGVLMLNACLTVRAGQANSHANRGWEKFTGRVIEIVAQRRSSGVVFMAWGTPAAKRVTNIDKKKHLVLHSVHPSPLSANRGYFECGHYRKANDWLITRYGPSGAIDWSLHGPPVGLPKSAESKAAEVKKSSSEGDVPRPEEIPLANLAPNKDEFYVDEDEEAAFAEFAALHESSQRNSEEALEDVEKNFENAAPKEETKGEDTDDQKDIDTRDPSASEVVTPSKEG